MVYYDSSVNCLNCNSTLNVELIKSIMSLYRVVAEIERMWVLKEIRDLNHRLPQWELDR